MQYHFGESLKQIRARYRLTQREIADMLSMTRENYGHIERGTTRIPVERFKIYVCRLANELAKMDINLYADYPVDELKRMAYRVVDCVAMQE